MKKLTFLMTILLFVGLVTNLNAQIYQEDFESGFVNYQSSANSSDAWALETVIIHGGTQSTHVTYTASCFDTLIQTTVFDLTGTTNPQLSFWHIAKAEGDYDECYVKISTDGGSTYTAFPVGEYLGASTNYSIEGNFWEDSYPGWGTGNETPDNTWWKKETFDLSAYNTSSTVIIMFELTGDGSGQRDGWYLDDIMIEEITCPAPTALTATNILSTSADLGWVTGGASDWNIEIDTAGFALGTGNFATISSNPFSLPPLLTPNTSYDFYVQDSCGVGDLSAWVGPFTFTTLCNAFSASFTEDFDAVTTPDLPSCWNDLVVATTTFADVITSTSQANSGANSARLYNSSATSVDYILLISPELSDLTFQANRIRFMAHMSSSGLEVGTMTDPTDETTYTLFQAIPENTGTWTEYTVDFDASYTETDTYIVLRHACDYTYDYIYIDDFTYEPIPSCFPPTTLDATNITTTGADFSWVAPTLGTPANYEWLVVLSGAGSGGTAEASGTTVAPIVISNTNTLSSSTSYDLFVRTDCGAGDYSAWAGPFTFTTACDVFSTNFTEGFEAAIAPPICWTMAYANATPAASNLMTHSTTEFYNGAQSFRFSSIATGSPYEQYLITPELNYGVSKMLTFQYRESTGAETFSVGASTTGNDYTTDFTWSVDITDASNTAWTEFSMIIPAGTKYVAIQYKSVYEYYLYVDEFIIDDVPTCPAPTFLTANAFETSAELAWTENGTATSWNIELDTVGFTPTMVATQTGVTNPYTYAGLTAETDYEYYVQADCGGNQSTWTGPFSFSTTMTPISNPTSCELGIDIVDDGCIEIPLTVSGVGVSEILREVKFIQTHTWVSDLDVTLISPEGISVTLTSANGGMDENYGAVGSSCSEYTSFDMNGLDGPITGGTAPFIGSFVPEGDFDDFNTGADLNGIWKIKICDLAAGDFGQFMFAELVFGIISTETDIITYTFPEQTGPATIDLGNHTVDIEVGFGTALTGLVATYTLSTGATADIVGTPQNSGTTVNDFSATGSLTYTITAEDLTTTQDWIVNVTVAAALLDETDIITYSFPEQTGPATIDAVNHTVDIEVNWEADLANLTADFTLSYNASADIGGTAQVSGVTANNFTSDVTYTITAEDGSTTQDWIVTVTLGATPQGALCADPIPLTLPVVNETGNTAGFGNNYDDTMACSSYYMTGDDIVYEFTLTQDGFISGDITTTDSWPGMFILDGCPDAGANCLVTNTTTGTFTSFTDQPITAGTYYVVISSWDAPLSIDFDFNLLFTPLAPEVAWDATTFVEDVANDGSIVTVVNLTLTDETFATTGILTTTEYSTANVPAGLSVEINATSTTVATVALTGNAVAHENSDDIANMEITFLDAAFTGGTATNVAGYTQTALVVDFEDAPIVLIINEVDADQVGTDANEFVELYDGGVGNSPLDGYTIVFYNGGTTDASYDAYDLDGYSTDANGYFVLGSTTVPNVTYDLGAVTNLIQNGADAVALYMDDATNFPNGTAITITNIVDALVYDTDDPDDAELLTLINTGQPQIDEAGLGDATLHSCSRLPNGTGGLLNTDTYEPAIPTPGAENMYVPVLAWDATTFTETLTNDGSIVTVVTLVLSDETFTVTSGAMTETTHYTVANVPTGLTVLVTAIDVNNATVELIGNATNHLDVDDIANMEITFLDAAFTGGVAINVIDYTQTAIIVDFFDLAPMTLVWDATTFIEDVANDGSISTVVNLVLVSETFTVTSGVMTATTHYTVANVPAGLTVLVTATDANNATIELTGNATSHLDVDDIANMEITFLDAAFSGGVAANVTGYTQTALVVDFMDPVVLTLSWDATTFVEDVANDGSISTVVNLTLNNETFATVGALTATDFSIANVPAGLTVEITTTSTTAATVTLTGNATNHANADDIANMEITFLDATFTGGVAANVTGYTQAALVVDFMDPALITDLDIVMPNVLNYSCDLTATEQVPICISNVGETVISSGEVITVYYEYPIGNVVSENITLVSDLGLTDTLCYQFTQTVDFSALGIYNISIYFYYANDEISSNDTLIGSMEHYEVIVDLGATNDTISVGAYPTTLDAGACASPGGFTCSYLWSDASTAQTLVVNADGWYTVTISDDNGCEGMDSVFVILDVLVDSPVNDMGISIYPNPTNNILNIEISNNNNISDLKIELISVHGQLIKELMIENNISEINVTDFAPGVYYLRINSESNIFIEKVVIQ